MFQPDQTVKENTAEFETKPLIIDTGFREYDARWEFGKDLNLMGVQALGFGLGTLLHEYSKTPDITPDITVAHDYRSYSQSIKLALITGLISAGIKVIDIGLAISPMSYFAQFHLDTKAVAMVTASHNENGWTGVKMGADKPLTFGPEDMKKLRNIVLNNTGIHREGGSYHLIPNIHKIYIDDLTAHYKMERKLKAVIACGNGTAGYFAPEVLQNIGIEVIPLNCNLDYNFPNHNPNPEDLKMLHALRDKVLETKADIGLAFDGDGDRCGVVDNEGEEIFSDKMGVLIARNLAKQYPNAKFVTDVKSTSLFATDPILKKYNATTEYWKTGHSYMKRRIFETNSLAGFEKSGHFFFNAPIGRGYDDGLITALVICDMLNNTTKTMADLRKTLPQSWGSPTMSPYCSDKEKYLISEQITKYFETLQTENKLFLDQKIIEINTINGVRITLEDGTWGLIRASSNKPSLVVVVESPVSKTQMQTMFNAIDLVLSKFPEIGEYDQKI